MKSLVVLRMEFIHCILLRLSYFVNPPDGSDDTGITPSETEDIWITTVVHNAVQNKVPI